MIIKDIFKKNNESGMILPLTLGLLALGGLIIASSLSYATTNLKTQNRLNALTKGSYAADAGIENVIWALRNGNQPPQQLSDLINGMNVNLQTINQGYYVLYMGNLVQPTVHNPYLDIDTLVTYDVQENAKQFTITITWRSDSGASSVHLDQAGARLPPGYTYKPGSADRFANNLSRVEPQISYDRLGCMLINWYFGSPAPDLNEQHPIATQTFHLVGPEGDTEGYYGWVVANREDVGAVSSIQGGMYEVTSTATSNVTGEMTGKIRSNIMIADETYITSWQVLR